MKLIENVDYFIKITDIPVSAVKGHVVPNDDGTYTVVLNAKHDTETQRRALAHELNHIINNDLQSDEDVMVIEGRAKPMRMTEHNGRLVPIFDSPAACADWLMSYTV